MLMSPTSKLSHKHHCHRFSYNFFILAIVILFLVIFLLILMHISQLDDSFCGCVICKLQNDTFCPGMFCVRPVSPRSPAPETPKPRVNLMIIRNVKILELIPGG